MVNILMIIQYIIKLIKILNLYIYNRNIKILDNKKNDNTGYFCIALQEISGYGNKISIGNSSSLCFDNNIY